MNRRISLSLFVALLCLTTPAISQVDTLAALSCFPLHIGNKWQFEEVFILEPPPDTSYRTITVIGDTTMPNGKTYRILENDWRFFRVDTSELKVYLYFPYSFTNSCPDSEMVYFNLTYPDSGYFTTCEDYQVDVDTGFGRMGYLPDSANYIEHFWFDGFTNIYKLYKGIGFADWWMAELAEIRGKLVAAIIDSVQYGQFIIVGIENPVAVPSQIQLFQNYPNPFNPVTTIGFQLSTTSEVELTIFNLSGRKIKTLLKERKTAGKHEIRWDGRDNKNAEVASGVYFYRLKTGSFSEVRRMLLIR